jgi:hypothetical protein
VFKPRRQRLAGHVARTGESEVPTGLWWEKLREGDHSADPGINGRIILKLFFRIWDGVTDWIDLAQDMDRRRAVHPTTVGWLQLRVTVLSLAHFQNAVYSQPRMHAD